jgi:hypothetical protein
MASLTFLTFSFLYFTCDNFLVENVKSSIHPQGLVQGRNNVGLYILKLFMPACFFIYIIFWEKLLHFQNFWTNM